MAKSPLDFSFDARVVGQYDALRGHPPEIAANIGAAFYREAQGTPLEDPLAKDMNTPSRTLRILELGVGTGRIAVPVARFGAHVVGIDLSAEMLATLHHQLLSGVLASESLPIDLVRGTITALPFKDNVFDAVMITHVLHLVPDWQSVLTRMAETVRRGGMILLGRDWVDPASMAGALRMAFRQAVMQAGFKTAAPAGGQPLHQALLKVGASAVRVGPEECIAAEWQANISPADVLAGIRSRDDAESWVLPDEILLPVCAQLESFASERWPDLQTPQPVLRRFVVTIYRNGL
jgi:2-polyprenyl-3-methyl-5-hydroxy-6-metoxy-1,4-benzoquinol methylase